MLDRGARIDPEAVRRRNEAAAGPAPRARRKRDGRAGAAARPRRRSQFRCSKSSRSSGRRPNPAAFDALLLTSANAVRLGGREAGDGFARFRSMPSARRRPTRRARPGSTSPATGDAGVDRLLGSLEPDLRLLHLCGEDRRTPSRGPAGDHAARGLSRRRGCRADLGQARRQRRHDPLAARGRAFRRAGRRSRHRSKLDRASPRSVPTPRRAAGDGWAAVESAAKPERRRIAGPRGTAVQQAGRAMSTSYRTGMSWSARLLIGLVLILVGAAALRPGLWRAISRPRTSSGLRPTQPSAAGAATDRR